MRRTRTTVEIFFAGIQIASYLRLHGCPIQYNTVENHMPPDHQTYLQWTVSVSSTGQSRSASTPLLWYAFSSLPTNWSSRKQVLLKLADRHSSHHLESACQKVLPYTSSPSLKSIQSILKSGQDKLPDKDVPVRPKEPKPHKFTRDASYYKREERPC